MTKKPPIRMNKLQIFYFHDFSGGAVRRVSRIGFSQNLKAFFFFAFQYFRDTQLNGSPAQKMGEKMIFKTKKVAKYR